MEQEPLFVSPGDVILRMALDSSLAGITDTVTSAIRAAQLKVETIISSKLSLRQQDSLFFLDSDAFSGIQPGGVYRLEIPSGFIRPDSPVTVSYDTNWNLPNVVNVPVGDPSYRVDYTRGYVLMDAPTYGDRFVRVQCTTGFIGNNTPNPAYPLTPTPAYDPLAVSAWNSGTLYQPGTAVTGADGEVYVALSTNQGADPTTGDLNWAQPTYATAIPMVYDSTAVYYPTQVVSLRIMGVVQTFICNATTTPGTLPTDTAYFTPVVMGPEKIPDHIYEAIMNMVPSIFDSSIVSNRDEASTIQYKKATAFANSLLEKSIRMGKGFCFRPEA